jgi:hypothetical protein
MTITSSTNTFTTIQRGGIHFYFLLSWSNSGSFTPEVEIDLYTQIAVNVTASVSLGNATFSTGTSQTNDIGVPAPPGPYYVYTMYACIAYQPEIRSQAFEFQVLQSRGTWGAIALYVATVNAGTVTYNTDYNTRPTSVTPLNTLSNVYAMNVVEMLVDLQYFTSPTNCYRIQTNNLNYGVTIANRQNNNVWVRPSLYALVR